VLSFLEMIDLEEEGIVVPLGRKETRYGCIVTSQKPSAETD
jgi:hypothetical protein